MKITKDNVYIGATLYNGCDKDALVIDVEQDGLWIKLAYGNREVWAEWDDDCWRWGDVLFAFSY